MSGVGTFRTRRNVRLQSITLFQADIRRPVGIYGFTRLTGPEF